MNTPDTDRAPRPRKPDWLKVRLGTGPGFAAMRQIVNQGGLHTVCQEAMCPNQGACWEHGRATLLILGESCTRGCAFCGVKPSAGGPCDTEEPARVAEAARAMGLKALVITSVTRDDLPDGGAGIWAATVRRVQEAVPGILVEVLVPDFGGSAAALRQVLDTRPAVFGHNLETVPRLYPTVRPGAGYRRSLDVLGAAHAAGLLAKTSLMVGVGETDAEVAATMRDAHAAGCEILYVGQYLQPTRRHLPVTRYVEPAQFEAYRRMGQELGFGVTIAGPLVRSSYHTEEQAAYVAQRLRENVA